MPSTRRFPPPWIMEEHNNARCMLELMHKLGQWPKDWPKHDTFYGVARATVVVEMNAAIRKVRTIIGDVFTQTSDELAKALRKFNEAPY